MAGGKRWTQQENDLLMKLVKKGVTPEQIFKSERFPGRTARAIDAQVKRLSIVPQKKNFVVSQITPVDIISLEEALKLWSDAYQKLCKLERASKAWIESSNCSKNEDSSKMHSAMIVSPCWKLGRF